MSPNPVIEHRDGDGSGWRGRSVLVTGAGGFVGSHLAERLAAEGANVRAFVRYHSSGTLGWLEHSDLRQEMEFVRGDLSDTEFVRQAVGGMDIVFHLGALIAIPYSYVAPASYVQTNLVGTLNVLQAARDNGNVLVVHTSTSEVYGTARYVPIDEQHPLQAQSPYAATKIAADKLAESYHHAFGLPVLTVRPFNTFGPRQSARAVIPSIIVQCLTGSVVRLGNVSPTRDLNYVSDTVAGFLAAGASPAACGQTINLGTGREISIRDLAHLIAQLVGTQISIQEDPQRRRPPGSEVDRLVADVSLATRQLAWRPRVSLEEGLTETIAWMRSNLAGYQHDAYAI